MNEFEIGTGEGVPSGYFGPTTAEQRVLDISDTLASSAGIVATDEAIRSGQEIQPPQIERVPRPQDPEFAAQQAAWNEERGRLYNAIGTLQQGQSQYQRELEEMRLSMQAAAFRPAPQWQPQAPTGFQPFVGNTEFDPNADVKAGQVVEVIGAMYQNLQAQFQADLQAQMARAQVGITPIEEQDVYARHPEFQAYPEPQRSQLVAQAVLIARKYRQPEQTTPQAPIAPIRPVAQNPALGYAQTAGNATPELQPPRIGNSFEQRWNAALQIDDPAKRERVLKSLNDEWMAQNGVQEKDIMQTAFRARI